MQDRNVWFQGKYDLFTIYLIPSVTIFLASFDSWIGTNLSVLDNRVGNKLLPAAWGFAIGVHYCAHVRYLFHIGKYRNPGGRILVYAAAAFLLMVVMILYMPEKYPLKIDLHALLAFSSSMLLAFSITGFLRFPGSHDQMRSRRTWGILWMMVACPALFLLETGFITSFLETFIITGLCGYLHYMGQLLAA